MYYYSEDVLHRDLRWPNIIFYNNSFYLIDFETAASSGRYHLLSHPSILIYFLNMKGSYSGRGNRNSVSKVYSHESRPTLKKMTFSRYVT